MKTWTLIFAVTVIAFELGCATLAQMSTVKIGKSHPNAQSAKSDKTVKKLFLHPLQSSSAGYPLPILDPDQMHRLGNEMNKRDKSLDLAEKGDVKAEQGNWPQALSYYQQALDLWTDDDSALYGLGKCAEAAGDTTKAIGYYRTAIYTNDPSRFGMLPGDGYQTNDVARLMEFSLLLGKAGQEQEALTVYRHAAHLLNYQDAQFNGGKQYLEVLLPEFGNKPGDLAYTPPRLAAMAHVGIAYKREDLDHKLAQVELQKAIDLAPDSPVPYFYKAQSIIRAGGHRREALADFQIAAQLGDDDTKGVVDKKLKDYSVEHDAKMGTRVGRHTKEPGDTKAVVSDRPGLFSEAGLLFAVRVQ